MRIAMRLFAVALLAATAAGQESVRRADKPGEFTKHLTPGLFDSWIIEGKQGETVIAYVRSNEFDPVLELATPGAEDDKVLFSVDDEGSESRFLTRLPADGEYRIRVHAFKYKGGGNYTLEIRRFQAQPLTIGQPLIGTFDHEGRSHVYFQAERDQVLVPQLKGAPSRWELLDVKGRRLGDWAGTVRIEDSGEHSLALTGRAGNRYELLIAPARRRDLAADAVQTGQLERNAMDVWSFEGQPGQFRVLEVESQGQLHSRLIFAPREPRQRPAGAQLARADNRPAIELLPLASKGGRQRYAAVLGRAGRYQLQLLAGTSVTYTLKMADPTLPIERDQELKGQLPVGGAAFYSFRAQPGQLLVANLGSAQFDPLLRLYDARGAVVQENDDGGGGLGSRIAHMVMREGLYRLQVSSCGDGGGGDFRLALRQQKLNNLPLGGRGEGQLQLNGTDFWSFTGEEGQTVLLSVRSSVCDPRVGLYSPDGVQLASDDNGGVGTDSLLAVTLPKAGRYTVQVSSVRGAGAYNLRLIDGD